MAMNSRIDNDRLDSRTRAHYRVLDPSIRRTSRGDYGLFLDLPFDAFPSFFQTTFLAVGATLVLLHASLVFLSRRGMPRTIEGGGRCALIRFRRRETSID